MIKLKQISTLMGPPDKEGNQKVIKRNILSDLYINEPKEIKYVEQVYNNKGKTLKNMCSIKLDGEFKTVKHSPEYVIELITPTPITYKGFK